MKDDFTFGLNQTYNDITFALNQTYIAFMEKWDTPSMKDKKNMWLELWSQGINIDEGVTVKDINIATDYCLTNLDHWPDYLNLELIVTEPLKASLFMHR